MGFLDKVKETTGKVTEQAKQVAAAGKDKIDDARLQKQIKSLQEEIGALVVASRRGQAPADLDAQIDAKVAEITDLEAQVEANGASDDTGTPAAAATAPPPPVAANVPTAPPSAPPVAPPPAPPA
jgi:hypothetical protein